MSKRNIYFQTGTIGFTRLPIRGGGKPGLELQPRAVPNLERARDRSSRTSRGGQRPGDRLRVTARRVQGEVRAVDDDVDRTDVSRNTFDDRREGIRDDRDLSGVRIYLDIERQMHDNSPQVKRPRDRRDNNRETEGGALIAFGEVDLPAGDRERVRANPSTYRRFSDQTPRRAGRVRLPELQDAIAACRTALAASTV